jgi:hypothetical protein
LPVTAVLDVVSCAAEVATAADDALQLTVVVTPAAVIMLSCISGHDVDSLSLDDDDDDDDDALAPLPLAVVHSSDTETALGCGGASSALNAAWSLSSLGPSSERCLALTVARFTAY